MHWIASRLQLSLGHGDLFLLVVRTVLFDVVGRVVASTRVAMNW